MFVVGALDAAELVALYQPCVTVPPLPRDDLIIIEAKPDARKARKAIGVGKVDRNAPCPCGSGRKSKSCCGR